MIFMVLSSVNNDVHIYLSATDAGCEVTYVGCTEFNNLPRISAKVTWKISISDKKTWMLRLKIWMLNFLEASRYLSKKKHILDKEKYFQVVNNPKEYFRRHENKCFMVFSFIVFNIPLDLIDDQYYTLHIKEHIFDLQLFWL